MRFFPQSIRARLMLAGLLFTGIALLLASLSIGKVLDGFVRRGLDERLDTQIALLARSVRADGSIDRAALQEIGPFTQHRRGWGWRIDGPGGSYTSREIIPAWLGERRADGKPDRGAREGRGRPEGYSRPRTSQGEGLYMRSLEKRTGGGTVRIIVSAPRALFVRLRYAAIWPVLLLLAALSLALLVATLLQLQIGLRPLKRLRQSLVEVRSGERDRIPGDQPAELSSVVAELNGLLDENEAALMRARGHVANLAHSLKTPLATLGVRLAEPGRDPDGQLGALVAQIDGAIRHHLGRARAASPGAPGQPVVPVAGAVQDLLQALGRIYAEKNIAADMRIEPDLAVKCDPQDLAEMLGNLLDNAWKWGSSRILVSARAEGKMRRIAIEDDGPGLSEEARAQALVPGRRLDEREDGHGFGLPIARELAELHGGALELGVSALGGLRVDLLLPG